MLNMLLGRSTEVPSRRLSGPLERPASLLLVSSQGCLLRLTIERRGGFGCGTPCVICLHHSVVILQIISDDLCVGLINRRTEGVDHFRDLGIPPSRTQKWRVHRYVIEAMAGAAIGFDSVDTWCLFSSTGSSPA